MTRNETAYICSLLSAPTVQEMERNMHAAREYAREAMSELKCRVFAPHAWLPELLDDTVPQEREIAMAFNMEILKLCTVIIVCHPKITKGMAAEIAFAQQHGIAIFVHPASGKYHPARRIPRIGDDADWRAWGI